MVGGQARTNVLMFRLSEIDFAFLPAPIAYDLYWDAEGIVRKDVRDATGGITEQWELVRWDIVL